MDTSGGAQNLIKRLMATAQEYIAAWKISKGANNIKDSLATLAASRH